MNTTIRKDLAGPGPLFLEDLPWRQDLRILVLAPHPDDFDAIAVTMRFFKRNGNNIQLSVITSSASGVEDSFCSPPTKDEKARIRECEQKASWRKFGLPDADLRFLRMPENDEGHPVESQESCAFLSAHLSEILPDLIFLPHGNDTNAGHRFAFAMLERHISRTGSEAIAFLNRDPKTISMKSDLYVFFGEQDAAWKSELLRCHQSQQRRNLNMRGYGLDERILRVNRAAADEIPGRGPYAEVYEIWLPGLH